MPDAISASRNEEVNESRFTVQVVKMVIVPEGSGSQIEGKQQQDAHCYNESLRLWSVPVNLESRRYIGFRKLALR